MKRYNLTAFCILLVLIIAASCTSQKPAQQQKTASEIVSPEAEASGAELSLRVWSVLSADQGGQEIKEIIRDNEIVIKSASRSGRVVTPYNGYLTLEINLQKIDKDPLALKVEWILQPEDDEPRLGISEPSSNKMRSQGFTIDFITDFEVTINVMEKNTVIASRKVDFSVSTPPTISIVQPTNDKIVNYGDSVKLIANAVDGAGNFPVVVWVVKHKNVERVLGVGSEIDTDRLDIGYNTIMAYTIDFKGNVMFADPVHVIIPYQAVKTRIISPRANQVFGWNQPVSFFARGNELEYVLTDANALSEEKSAETDLSYTPGSGFFKEALPSGAYRVTFRGKFGTASQIFTVKDKLRDIAQVTRIEGYVLMSGQQGKWQQVKAGDKIPEGYIIRAIGNGLAEIHLTSGLVYILNQGNSIRILANGNIVKNLNKEDLTLYSLVDPENIREVQKNLKPLIGQLEQLLKNHEIVELESENKEDILRLLDLIFKGQLKIDEVTIE